VWVGGVRLCVPGREGDDLGGGLDGYWGEMRTRRVLALLLMETTVPMEAMRVFGSRG